MITLFVVLLQGPKTAPPTVQLVVPAAPAAPVAMAPTTPPPPVKAPPPVIQKTPVQEEPAAPPHRVVAAASRHPAFVRRPSYGSRRSAHQSEGSSMPSEDAAPTRSKPPQDDLDRLLAGQ
jgi:hypothetical protein